MYTYLGILKKDILFDDQLRSFLEEKNIEIEKYLPNLDLLIIKSEKELTKEELECFDHFELNKNFHL